MLDFHLSREAGITVLQLKGQIVDPEERDKLGEAFAFVQADDLLILDLSDVTALEQGAAALLHDVLGRRSVLSESVVVSIGAEVPMQLVLHDVDRVSPIVSRRRDADAILDRSSKDRRLRT